VETIERETVKDFEEYKTKLSFPCSRDIEAELRLTIANTPMTEKQRLTALQKLPEAIRQKMATASIPYREDVARLEAQFWLDCREDMGYDQWLDGEGMEILERTVGYSAINHADTYSRLYELVHLTERLKGHYIE
jgi:hypothetical protein